MNHHHLIDLDHLSKEECEQVVELATKIYNSPNDYSHVCNGKILATLFYEPSTRTQMSFQAAMLRLGGRIIGFDNPQNSSVSKGENLVDTIKIVSGYADIIAMRHPMEGSLLAGAQYSDCAVINAGDGGHLHPTQTLTDLVTLALEIGHLNGLVIGLCGDLKNGRTVHSLIKALTRYNDIEFIFISTNELTIPDYFKHLINQSNCTFKEISSLEEAIPYLDVLYMTRIQKERFCSEELYESQKNVYTLDVKKLEKAKQNLKILHPLPRVDEINMQVDKDGRAIYFKQAKYGVYARMALIMTLLNETADNNVLYGEKCDIQCKNPHCITGVELYLEHSYVKRNGCYFCEYCDSPTEF